MSTRRAALRVPFGVLTMVAVWTPGRDDPPLVAVVGPTATGKSDLAVALAAELDGEVVNADAMQLYRGMDVGTAKLTPRRAGRACRTTCSTSSTSPRPRRWRPTSAQARAVVERLLRGRAAPRCWSAGPGLYVQAVVDELEFPGTDPALRAELEAELAELGPAALHARLAAVDPAAAAGRAALATAAGSCARWRWSR